jgi:galactokinase/mevalonate kinase-like predicted kinase
VLACSVPLRARVSIEGSDTSELVTGGQTLRVRGGEDLELQGDLFDLGRAALAALEPAPVCRIAYETEIPLRSGLAGSTALLVAILEGLRVLAGRRSGPYELAELARHVERTRLGVACGWVDPYMCTFGGLRYVDFRGKEDERPGGLPLATVEPLGSHVKRLPFVLAFTGIEHDSGAVHAPALARLERGDPEVLGAHRRMAAIAREGKAALLEEDWAGLGELMNENHALQRGLGGSGEANERLIEAALGAGSPGAKLAGAGHGGTIVALWPRGSDAALEKALRRAGAAALYRPLPVPGVTVETD